MEQGRLYISKLKKEEALAQSKSVDGDNEEDDETQALAKDLTVSFLNLERDKNIDMVEYMLDFDDFYFEEICAIVDDMYEKYNTETVRLISKKERKENLYQSVSLTYGEILCDSFARVIRHQFVTSFSID